jgi:hypothetical protein
MPSIYGPTRDPPRPLSVTRVVLASAALAVGAAVAQGQVATLQADGETFFSVPALAAAAGGTWSEFEGSLTLRLREGILVVFAGSRQAVVRGVDTDLPAAPRIVDRIWFVPVRALILLGWTREGSVLRRPDGGQLELVAARPVVSGPPELTPERIVEVEFARGVRGLTLLWFDDEGEVESALLLADVVALSLAYPETAASIDAFLLAQRNRKVLFFAFQAERETEFRVELEFRQGELEFRPVVPFDLVAVDGEVGIVEGGGAVLGVLFVPDAFELNRPIEVTWGLARTVFTFRTR